MRWLEGGLLDLAVLAARSLPLASWERAHALLAGDGGRARRAGCVLRPGVLDDAME